MAPPTKKRRLSTTASVAVSAMEVNATSTSANETTANQDSPIKNDQKSQRSTGRKRKKVRYTYDDSDSDYEMNEKETAARMSDDEWEPNQTSDQSKSNNADNVDDNSDDDDDDNKCEESGADSDGEKSDNGSESDGSDFEISNDAKKIISEISPFKVSQIRELFVCIKALRTINGETPFSKLKCEKGKEAMLKQAQSLIVSIFSKDFRYINGALKEYCSDKRWEFSLWCGYTPIRSENEINFNKWENAVKHKMRTIQSITSRGGTAKLDILAKKLRMYDNSDLVSVIVSLYSNHSELQSEIESLLPNCDNIISTLQNKHSKLTNAIRKAMPYNRYGSNRDNYAFKRCRSAINAATNAMLKDGDAFVKAKSWAEVLEYIICVSNNVTSLPEWEQTTNNTHRPKVNKKMTTLLTSIQKNLKNSSDVQKQQIKDMQKIFS